MKFPAEYRIQPISIGARIGYNIVTIIDKWNGEAITGFPGETEGKLWKKGYQ